MQKQFMNMWLFVHYIWCNNLRITLSSFICQLWMITYLSLWTCILPYLLAKPWAIILSLPKLSSSLFSSIYYYLAYYFVQKQNVSKNWCYSFMCAIYMVGIIWDFWTPKLICNVILFFFKKIVQHIINIKILYTFSPNMIKYFNYVF